MGTLHENIEKVKQENEILKTELRETRDQLKESEAQRAIDKEAMEAQRERDKADSEAKLKELEVKFEAKLNKLFSHSTQHQRTSTPPASDEEMPKASNVHLYKP